MRFYGLKILYFRYHISMAFQFGNIIIGFCVGKINKRENCIRHFCGMDANLMLTLSPLIIELGCVVLILLPNDDNEDYNNIKMK